MIVYHPCPHCRAQAAVATGASTPQELERDRGEHFVGACDECGKSFDVEAMRTRARVNPSKLLLGVGASLLLCAVIWLMGYIALIGLAPAFLMYGIESRNVQSYNALSYRKWG